MRGADLAGAPRRKRLAVVRFWYEGNAFCPIPATRRDFERREWQRGHAALQAAADTATELAAVEDFARAHDRHWEVVVSRCASALPAGAIDDEFFDAFMAEVLTDLADGAWDAIYVSLHGAAITARREQPEFDLVRALHAAHPAARIGASFDLHANHTPAWVEVLDIACGYRTYPHVDMRETAARTLALLVRTVDGSVRPVGALRNDGIYLSSANMRTDQGPMADLQAMARDLICPPLLDIAVFGGFAYANTDTIGASVMAWADGDRAAAQQAVDILMAEVLRRVPEFDIPLPAPADGIALALQLTGLVAVTDAADNPLSGGIGDTPGLLRALVDAAVDVETVFASFADAPLVARAHAAGIGACMAAQLGGRWGDAFGPSVPLDVVVERLTDGHFVNTGPMERGSPVACGRTVVLRAGCLRVIVTEYVSPCNDPAFFALHGVDLSALRLLCVKAKNHFRAAFASLCNGIVDVEAPGPASLNLGLLPLRRRRG